MAPHTLHCSVRKYIIAVSFSDLSQVLTATMLKNKGQNATPAVCSLLTRFDAALTEDVATAGHSEVGAFPGEALIAVEPVHF